MIALPDAQILSWPSPVCEACDCPTLTPQVSDDLARHAGRVADLALALARRLQISPDDCGALRVGALWHDIGKLAVPRSILDKPGPLTFAERAIIRLHTLYGPLMCPRLPPAALQIIVCHHERWDGQGYPLGLAGAAIPKLARIVAVADVYDALIHDRVYRPAWEPARARAHISEEMARQFDPAPAAALLKLSHQELDHVCLD